MNKHIFYNDSKKAKITYSNMEIGMLLFGLEVIYIYILLYIKETTIVILECRCKGERSQSYMGNYLL